MVSDEWWETQRQSRQHWLTFNPFFSEGADRFFSDITGIQFRSEMALKREFGLMPPVTADGRVDKEIVRAKVDMVDLYLRLFDVPPPRNSGSRYVSVRCGIHGEKLASLSIDKVLKRVNCFSCNFKSDCFGLWMEVNKVPFYQAVNALDEMY